MNSVAFYGRLAEAAWREARTLDLPPGVATIGDLRRWLPSAEPRLAGQLGATVRVALDDAIVGDDAAIAADSEIAFLPPVSGG